MKTKSIHIGIVLVLFAGCAMGQAINEVNRLTLEQAFQLAQTWQPELAVAKASTLAAEGRAQQAGAFPNPEAVLGIEQVPSSPNSPDEREYIGGIAQTIPLGARLAKAREAELMEKTAALHGFEAKWRQIRKQIHGAFATALYQERAHALQLELLGRSEKSLRAVQARVDAGDAIPEEVLRMEMVIARVRAEVRRVEALRERSLIDLATVLGKPELRIKSLAGHLESVFELPSIAALAQQTGASPEAEQARAEVRAREARLSQAEAERVPDVKVEVLYHRLEVNEANTLDFGISVPLPIFNRNQGRIREARAELAAAEARMRATQNDLTRRRLNAQSQLRAALAVSQAIKSEILPGLEQVLKAAHARYAEGDTSLTELWPVQREWAEAQQSYLESLREVMLAWGELKSLSS